MRTRDDLTEEPPLLDTRTRYHRFLDPEDAGAGLFYWYQSHDTYQVLNDAGKLLTLLTVPGISPVGDYSTASNEHARLFIIGHAARFMPLYRAHVEVITSRRWMTEDCTPGLNLATEPKPETRYARGLTLKKFDPYASYDPYRTDIKRTAA
jgi:hypothetical protein